MSQYQEVTPTSPVLAPSELKISRSPSFSAEKSNSKRPCLEDLDSKRIRLNTPEVSIHMLSPAPVKCPEASPIYPEIFGLKGESAAQVGALMNPIVILDLSTTAQQDLRLSPAPGAVNVPVVAPNGAFALFNNTATSPVGHGPPATGPIVNNQMSQEIAAHGADQLTKKQLERLQKQEQRELERLERERKKEEEKRAKKEEKERKEREKQLKREQLEKEKERKREEEKAKREEKRKKLEEEKKRKEDERKRKEEERNAKEQERRQREEERKRKEEHKDRSQMKISSFFAVKPVTSKTAARLSTPTVENADANDKEEKLLYRLQFLPFFIKQNVTMASNGLLLLDELSTSISSFDSGMKSSQRAELSALVPTWQSTTPAIYTSSLKLLEALNSASTTEKVLHQLVQNLPPIKYLLFYENSKPPYVGTWCSEKHLATDINATNPLETSLTGYDYNYDSDLDWQNGDDDEGEDIDDLEDGEDEEDEVNDEDDMEDFVDNNEVVKRRIPVGTLQSVSRWNEGTEEDNAHFDDIKYERLDYDIHFPIDPLCDYWSTAKVSVSIRSSKETKTVAEITTPVKSGQNGTTPNILTPQKPAIKDAKVVAELIKFVEKNSDFTIGTLSELAKKEFKSYTKSMLKHTIQEVAIYNKKKSVWEIRQSTWYDHFRSNLIV